MLQKESILVIGASTNPNRSSYLATKYLYNKGFSLFAIANRKGSIDGLELSDTLSNIDSVDTVTIYLSADRQKKYYDYILSLHPKRIIFNPGTENPEFEKLANNHHIQTISGCTIAMLTAGIL
ncbi:MAG: CoA-binding protein [Bacteroidetes bacterium]|jgi:hypothetical protein|nr:CoA-binding protein [Bacteroidota bacterium]HMT36421.1 CoA-binding protein [Chitinophagaceae bacterium]MBK7040491.1 CoA-binding protein [Bacteroidota bacterium]MBK7587172.1 CoA-binding protein [Bacteroidota bacterium]MBK8328309.1 CoA-binding protein [Bacteroidota bacterium]